MGAVGKLASVNPDEIIDRIANGEYGSHIAAELGVAKQSLQQKIREHPRYVQAREIGCEVRLDSVMSKFDDLQAPRPPMKPRPSGDANTDLVALAEWKDQVTDWRNVVRTCGADLARVDSLFRAVTWQAEREFPHRWGKQPDVLIQQFGNAEGAIDAISEAVLDKLKAVDNSNVALRLRHSSTERNAEDDPQLSDPEQE